MQEDRAAGRERQRVRDCVPVFWSVCSFFLRLLCVHVCVCAWVCWCVCVCVFAQFEGHPGRDCSADLSHPHTSPLFTWLSICPHIYHQKQISCWKQIQVSKLYLLHEATVNSEQIVCVCVYGNINEFSPAYKRQKARLKMVRRLYCVWTNTHKQNVLLIPVQLCCPFEPVSIFINYQSVSELGLLLNLAQFVFVSSPTI